LYIESVITVTPQASAQIKNLIAEKPNAPSDAGLRIAVEGGGCSGMQYVMSVDARKPDDLVFAGQDANVLVDPASLVFIDGSSIDYVDGLTAAGFRIHNPNAKQSCGCGTSFEA
jgi:iron-sulfur cluster insertion protein